MGADGSPQWRPRQSHLAQRPGREKKKHADTAAPYIQNNTKHSGVSPTHSSTLSHLLSHSLLHSLSLSLSLTFPLTLSHSLSHTLTTLSHTLSLSLSRETH